MQMQNNPFGNMANMLQQFQQFKSSFTGDPQQQVMQLLNSGKMSQEQFNQLQMMAKQFQGMLH
jgi:hypothetical protein